VLAEFADRLNAAGHHAILLEDGAPENGPPRVTLTLQLQPGGQGDLLQGSQMSFFMEPPWREVRVVAWNAVHCGLYGVCLPPEPGAMLVEGEALGWLEGVLGERRMPRPGEPGSDPGAGFGPRLPSKAPWSRTHEPSLTHPMRD
jgi:hypothetical protein